MLRERLFLSTIGADAPAAAEEYGLGLEIAEYCTAENMDRRFAENDAAVREKLRGVSRTVLHAPFNELFPCAIDPLARELAAKRFRQAIELAGRYGAEKVIVHGGYNPRIYYPVWYVEKSAAFWREFMDGTDMEIVLENVLEETPDMLRDIVDAAAHPRLGLCLDVGHVNAYSSVSPEEWLARWGHRIRHFHIHNNNGTADTHSPLFEGSMDLNAFLTAAAAQCPEATFTLELPECGPSVRWLADERLI